MSNDLVGRLRGEYRIPITDGLGAVGAGDDPDSPHEFVRHFKTPPIQHEAADRIEELEQEVEEWKQRCLTTFIETILLGSTSNEKKNIRAIFETTEELFMEEKLK